MNKNAMRALFFSAASGLALAVSVPASADSDGQITCAFDQMNAVDRGLIGPDQVVKEEVRDAALTNAYDHLTAAVERCGQKFEWSDAASTSVSFYSLLKMKGDYTDQMLMETGTDTHAFYAAIASVPPEIEESWQSETPSDEAKAWFRNKMSSVGYDMSVEHIRANLEFMFNILIEQNLMKEVFVDN